jgi:hypothetical protein
MNSYDNDHVLKSLWRVKLGVAHGVIKNWHNHGGRIVITSWQTGTLNTAIEHRLIKHQWNVFYFY